MPTIHDQLAWEERMIQHGVERFRAQQDKAIVGDRAHETRAGSTMLRNYVLQISDHIQLYLAGKHPDGRRRNKYAKLLATLNTDKAAMFCLKAIIGTLYNPKSLQTIAVHVGRCVEDDIRFTKFEAEYKVYYDELIRSFERGNTKSYDHKRNVLSVKSRDKGMEWEAWDRDTLFGVGSLVVSLLMEVCDLVEVKHIHRKGGRQEAFIAPTDACVQWVMSNNALNEVSSPDLMPCIIPPADWTSPTDGGFYSAPLRTRSPLVKNKWRTRPEVAEAEMPGVLAAINGMQRTGWRVNARVLAVLRDVWHNNLQIGMPRSDPYEIPPSPLAAEVKVADLVEGDPRLAAFEDWKNTARELHTMERERRAHNLAVARTVRIAGDMSAFDAFWYVYQCDFRGRVYSTTSGLSPQGTDHSKGLLEFGTAKPMGERGWFWFRVHGANKFGNDKLDYDERVQWVDDNREHWLSVARDPLSARDVWKDADKPFQFLAWCFEYADAVSDPMNYCSRLPIALDGSCNGLQHFSAMLRDPIGGAAVNLVPSSKPADIYQEVGDVCTRKLKGLRALNNEEHAGAANWLAMFQHVWGEERMNRKLPKKPVMTLPYGSTSQACTETIFRWTQDTAPDFFDKSTAFRHALYLSPRLWASIGEVVVAARQAMDWLQNCASILAKEGHPIRYNTPLGFPVRQAVHKYTTRQIESQINGRLQLRIATDTDELDPRKQRQGSSPNFVHSIDATHLTMCVLAGLQLGIDSFAMIHDDFGVHACDTEVWHGVIRQEFVKLHGNHDLLKSFKDQHEEQFGIVLPELPCRGTLDLDAVLASPYFFG